MINRLPKEKKAVIIGEWGGYNGRCDFVTPSLESRQRHNRLPEIAPQHMDHCFIHDVGLHGVNRNDKPNREGEHNDQLDRNWHSDLVEYLIEHGLESQFYW